MASAADSIEAGQRDLLRRIKPCRRTTSWHACPTKAVGAFVASGLLAGTAGAIWASYYPYVDGQVAFGLEAAVIAAVVVGGVALRGGRGTVLGVAVGVLGLFALRKVLVVGGLPDQYLLAVYGGAIIVAVTADTLLARRRAANARRII